MNNNNLVLKRIFGKNQVIENLKELLISRNASETEINRVLEYMKRETSSGRVLYDNDIDKKMVGMFLINYSSRNGLFIRNFVLTNMGEKERIDSYKSFLFDYIFRKAVKNELNKIIYESKESFNEPISALQKYILSSTIGNFKIINALDTDVLSANDNDDSRSSKKRHLNEDESNIHSKKPRSEDTPTLSERKHAFQAKDSTIDKPLEVTLKKMYVHQIQSGQKTIEGRINNGMFKNLKVNQNIRFFYFQDQKDDAVCKIKDIKYYRTFKEMLEIENFKKCIPDAIDLQSAINAYDVIPGYKERSRKFGVVAIYLELLKKK